MPTTRAMAQLAPAPTGPQLGDEAEAVLAVLAGVVPDATVRVNDVVRATALPTGHVGRHLRTLEGLRMARYASGGWAATERGRRHGGVLPTAA